MIAAEISPSAIDGDAGARLDALARKHLDLVYAAALRQVRDPHMAADVTQAVFMLLQKKHARFGPGTIVSAWLLRATRYTCLTALHQRRRASHHERKAAAMRVESPVEVSPEAAEWAAIIDAALERLGKADREAIAATYFEGMTHKKMGQRMGITEAAAHKRVQRALARLRGLLEKKGARFSAAGVAGAVAMVAKPAAAPAAVGNAVMLSLGGHVPAGVSILAKGTTIMMKLVKVKAAAVLMMAAAGVGLLGTATYQHLFAQETSPRRVAPPLPTAPAGEAPAAMPAENQIAANAADFQPVVELTINDEQTGKDFLADLDTGKLFTITKETTEKFSIFSWFEKSGIDLLYEGSTSTEGLMGIEMAVIPRPPNSFDRDDAQALIGGLEFTSPGMPALLSVRPTPRVYAFRTREGGVGLLQIVNVQANPGAALIRYKLLTPVARDRAAKVALSTDILPELAKQARLVMAATDTNDKASASEALRNFATVMHMFSETMRGFPSGPEISRDANMATIAYLTVSQAENENALKAALAEVKKTLGPVIEQLHAGPEQGKP